MTYVAVCKAYQRGDHEHCSQEETREYREALAENPEMPGGILCSCAFGPFKPAHRYEVRHSVSPERFEWTVADTKLGYTSAHCGPNEDHAQQIAAERNALWEKISSATEHHCSTRTDRRGGRTYGHQGGYYRESEAHCSCGWSQTGNGQTYQESMQAIREHLKEMDVYTTPLEQTVYAHIRPGAVLATQIAAQADKTVGRVQKVLDKLVERGNIEEYEPGCYRLTDKWFSWND